MKGAFGLRYLVLACLAIVLAGCSGSAEKAAEQYAASWNAGDIDAVWEGSSSAWRSNRLKLMKRLGGTEEKFKQDFAKNFRRELKVVKVVEEKHVAKAEFLYGTQRVSWDLIEEDDGKWRVKPQ